MPSPFLPPTAAFPAWRLLGASLLSLLGLVGCSTAPTSHTQAQVDTHAASCTLPSAHALAAQAPRLATPVAGSAQAPEAASGYRPGLRPLQTQHYAIATSTPLATQAGCAVLRAGGTAVDAAVAVQAVLGLVEPQSSGLGGGAFLLYFHAATGQVYAYDGRETAPAAATAYDLLRQDPDDPHSPPPVPDVRRSGRSIGVPGVVRMLELAHQAHGHQPWATLLQPAQQLARDGFAIPPRMAQALAQHASALQLDANARALFLQADGRPHPEGTLLRNPAYAATLQALATQGADALYHGPLAQALVDKAQQRVGDDAARSPITPSRMTLADLAAYRALERPPLCRTYRSRYRICTMPPPSSGGVAVLQTLGILENFDLASVPPHTPTDEGGVPAARAVHWISEAERLAYADRDLYLADTDFVPLPGRGLHALLDPSYLQARAAHIQPARSLGQAQPGQLLDSGWLHAADSDTPEHGTAHFSIVDAYGNAVAMTSSVEASLGSLHMVGGFVLSNQLTDFAAQPTDAHGLPRANRLQPGKRPRSSMAPVLVLDLHAPRPEAQLYLATGSPGGGAIIQYVVKTLVATLDWGLDAQQSASLMNFGAFNHPSTLLDGSHPHAATAALADTLRHWGHQVDARAQTSGMATLLRQAASPTGAPRWQAGVDPRRDGLALGGALR